MSEKWKKLFNKTCFSIAEVSALSRWFNSLSRLILFQPISAGLFKPAKSLLINIAFAKLIPLTRDYKTFIWSNKSNK